MFRWQTLKALSMYGLLLMLILLGYRRSLFDDWRLDAVGATELT